MRASNRWLLGIGSLVVALLTGIGIIGMVSQPKTETPRTDTVPFLAGTDFTRTDNGLRITGTTQLSTRSYRIFLASESVSATAFADGNSIVVTLPEGFDETDESRRYPVLYLLNGSGSDGGSMQWFERGEIESVLGESQMIAVMPDGGNTGWYTNWKSPSEEPRDWQTMHLDEVVPWVDESLPTVATRSGRAIGGVSMGGYGAIRYAQERPELFAEAFSISGILDFRKQEIRKQIDQQIVASGAPSGAVFGAPGGAEESSWSDNDPLTKVEKLNDTRIQLSAGTGSSSEPEQLEPLVRESTETFARELTTRGIEHDLQIFDDKREGCDGGHNWGCWVPEARRLIPTVLSGLNVGQTPHS